MKTVHALRAALVAALASVSAGAQTVHVVDDDGGPGVDFTSVADAVSAAAAGDVVLVRDGEYGSPSAPEQVTLTRTIDLVAEAGASVVVRGRLSAALPADAQAFVHGLTVLRSDAISPPTTQDGALHVVDCAGTVWIEECSFGGTGDPFTGTVTPAGFVDGSHEVVLVDSAFSGTDAFANAPSGTGLWIEQSTVRTYAVEATGGSGDGSKGGAPGVLLQGGLLIAEGCAFTGGDASEDGGLFPNCAFLTAGGAGAKLLSSSMVVIETQLTGGFGDLVACSFGGPTVEATGSATTYSPATAVGLAAPSPLRVGELGTLRIDGPPGALAFLGLSLTARHPLVVAPGKTLLLGGIPIIATLGPLDAKGVLEVDLLVPPLPPGFDGAGVVAQAAASVPGVGARFGAGARVVLLAAGL